ncbi:DUF922 domain-containing Zn-dependent protease [Hymenobacter sp. BT175]|uniref:DUF922 domain-containing protein n=1 Tax=Hymenobacter translucens TaxID=2886507 RepID=UPI001D0F205D|nr:DUF922 domain-containing protein [Hymenobacter translucens]MCC2546688.1 DUF922 domain-containing Zn-dependent protease [Hymenobacter translucens]
MLFSFLLPLTFLLTAPAQGPAKAPAPVKATIGWLPDRPLTWADFQARPHASEQLAALTSSTLDVQVGCTDFEFHATVSAVFVPSESWVRDVKRASPALLRHEQLHFDLTELHARLLRQKLSLTKMNCMKLQPALNNMTNLAFAAWKREESRYDGETNHGLNTAKQEFWEAQVKQRLALLNQFAQAPK